MERLVTALFDYFHPVTEVVDGLEKRLVDLLQPDLAPAFSVSDILDLQRCACYDYQDPERLPS